MSDARALPSLLFGCCLPWCTVANPGSLGRQAISRSWFKQHIQHPCSSYLPRQFESARFAAARFAAWRTASRAASTCSFSVSRRRSSCFAGCAAAALAALFSSFFSRKAFRLALARVCAASSAWR